MNIITVMQTSQGFAECLLASKKGSRPEGVVIGYDGRHNSKKFARHAAYAFRQNGFRVYWYEREVHTPMVPFAIGVKKAVAGIMITASHNPAEDNGYKVYEANGCQINVPVDELIMEHVRTARPLPQPQDLDHNLDLQDDIFLGMTTSYLSRIRSLFKVIPVVRKPSRFVYTPLHGVGFYMMKQVCESLGYRKDLSVVDAQASQTLTFRRCDILIRRKRTSLL